MTETEADLPRVGVFLCRCGTNIAGTVDIPRIAQYAEKIPGVAYVEQNLHTCSSEGISKIKEAIRNRKLERVVVAACTPRTHEPLFMAAVEEAGLNRYLFQMVNIREHDSWVHTGDKEAATEKAQHLVNMAVAKAINLEPETRREIEVTPSALVVGAGVSGMTAALSLADQGFQVYLVEKDAEPGGLVKDLHKLSPTDTKADMILAPMIEAVRTHKNVSLFTDSKVTGVNGFIGHFNVEITTGQNKLTTEVGTIIVATGAEPLSPEGYYQYGLHGIITQLELEKKLVDDTAVLPNQVSMIQCVGAMEEKGRAYCSRICCGVAIKNALEIKRRFPSTKVNILYRDLQTYGIEYEQLYRDSLEAGVSFINFDPHRPPEVSITTDGQLNLQVYDTLLGEEYTLEPGMIILSTPLTPREESKELAKILRVPLTPDGFFLEAHPKMRPMDFSSDGIYLCGTAHSPKNIPECISQALGAASRAAIPMKKGRIMAEATTAVLDPEKCVGCGACATACPFDAIIWGPLGTPKVIDAACKGCGVCTVECPVGAMQLRYFKDSQLTPAIDALLHPFPDEGAQERKPVILVMACKWCSYAAADFAGVMRLQYPASVRIVLVPCSGKVDFRHIYKGFMSGADGIIVAGCLKEQCHYVDGNIVAERRVEAAKKTLDALKIGGNRLEMFFCSAGMPRDFAEYMRDFTERIRKLGVASLENNQAFRSLDVKTLTEDAGDV